MKALLIISSLTLSMLYHCGSETETEQFDFTIKVDSIVYPRNVNIKDTISIKLYGKIGSWSSEQFKRIDINQTNDSVKIRVIGINYVMINSRKNTYLDGIERKIFATQPGVLHLLVQQPEGISSLEGSITVQ
jgi:hypothetical protein